MNSQEFEKELKAIDPRFAVIDNPNRPGLSNIFFDGKNYDLPVISTHNIKDEEDPAHRYEFPNGWTAVHHTRPVVLARVSKFLEDYKSGNMSAYAD